MQYYFGINLERPIEAQIKSLQHVHISITMIAILKRCIRFYKTIFLSICDHLSLHKTLSCFKFYWHKSNYVYINLINIARIKKLTTRLLIQRFTVYIFEELILGKSAGTCLLHVEKLSLAVSGFIIANMYRVNTCQSSTVMKHNK
jgi:hypothetical protein